MDLNIYLEDSPQHLWVIKMHIILGSFLPYSSYFLAYEYFNFYAVKLTKHLEHDGNKSKLNLLIPLITSPLAEAISVVSNKNY